MTLGARRIWDIRKINEIEKFEKKMRVLGKTLPCRPYEI
jgi:hypothetical protein